MEPRGWNPLPLSGRVAAAPELGVLPLGLSLRPTIGAAAFPSSKIFWPRPLTRMADAVRPLPRRGERGRGRCPYITSPFGGEVVDAQRRVRGLGRLVTDHPLEGLVRRLGSVLARSALPDWAVGPMLTATFTRSPGCSAVASEAGSV